MLSLLLPLPLPRKRLNEAVILCWIVNFEDKCFENDFSNMAADSYDSLKRVYHNSTHNETSAITFDLSSNLSLLQRNYMHDAIPSGNTCLLFLSVHHKIHQTRWDFWGFQSQIWLTFFTSLMEETKVFTIFWTNFIIPYLLNVPCKS